MSAGDISAPDAMTVSQLAQRTGIPPRRVRFYVQQELLPPPVGRGRASYYTARHLERLQQIVALRNVNLSLDEIRERLTEADDAAETDQPEGTLSRTWRRWEIIPGVEMHASDELDEETLSAVQVMVGAVRHVLESGDLPAGEWSERDE